MKGAIAYLRTVRQYCMDANGDCKNCPLGKEKDVKDCLCPRLTQPRSWDDYRILEMIKIGGSK
jgi:hypothetical protein